MTYSLNPLDIQRGDLPESCRWPLSVPRHACWTLEPGLVAFHPGHGQEACVWDVRTPQTAVHCPDDLHPLPGAAGRAWRAQPSSRPLPAGVADIMAALVKSRTALRVPSGPAQGLLQAGESEVYWRLRASLTADLNEPTTRAVQQLDAYWLRDQVRAALQNHMPPGLAIALTGRLQEFSETLHWHWAWLHAEQETSTVNDLQRTTPALANLLAEACATWPRRDYVLQLSWRLAGPQTELLQALGWPADPWVARLLRRLRGPLCRPDLLRQLRLWLAQPQLHRALRDLPQWAAGEGGDEVLDMLLCHGLSPLLLWRTLRGDPARRRERLCALEADVLQYCALAEVTETFGALETLASRKQLRHGYQQLVGVAATLPRKSLMSVRRAPRLQVPRIPGLVRLNSIPDLVHAGERLGNCLASYIVFLKDHRNDQVWLLDGEEPVAIHLRFDPGVQRWQLVEASGRGHRPLSTEQKQALQHWLDPPDRRDQRRTSSVASASPSVRPPNPPE